MHDHTSDPRAPVAPGDVLAEKYRVERVLGAGGMGVVVAATHLELKEKVAVKFLHPEAIQSAEAAARFLREARVAVKIRSEHVARVIDVGRLDNGAPYMVMEYLEGEDLAAQIARGPLPVALAVDYVIQACAAMMEAHRMGVVHRDLKPANLFVVQSSDGTPVVKVLDFGISKLNTPDVSEAGLTRTDTMMGSPYYMSPEQLRSARDVDHRTDVWALGTILFELLTAHNAFNGQSLAELVASIMTERPRSISQFRSDVPAELMNIINSCLQRNPEDRYQSVADLANDLAGFASREGQLVVERISRVAGSIRPPDAVLGNTRGSWSRTQAPKKQRRSLIVLAAAGSLALLGGGVWLVTRSLPANPGELQAEPSSQRPPPAANTVLGGGGPARVGPEQPAASAAAPSVSAMPSALTKPDQDPAAGSAPDAAPPSPESRLGRQKPAAVRPVAKATVAPAAAKATPPDNPGASNNTSPSNKPAKPAPKNPLQIELK